MRTRFIFHILLLNFLFSICASFAIGGFCSWHEPNYTEGSTFQSNLQKLIVSLPRNKSQTSYFYNATYGTAPDQVYTLVMCYADASPPACNSCLTEASNGIVKCCSMKKNGIAWYDACMIRYFDMPFNASNNTGILISDSKVDGGEYESLGDPEKFRGALQQLIDALATNASKSALKLAAGTTKYRKKENIYALVQCTKQLPPYECQRCIGDLTHFQVELLNDSSSVVADQSFKTASCYMRIAFRPFYVISEAHAPWPSTGKRSTEPIPTQILAIIVGALLFLMVDIELIGRDACKR